MSLRGGGCAPSGWASLWEYQAAQSSQARPEEVQEPSFVTAKAGTSGHFDHAVEQQRGKVLMLVVHLGRVRVRGGRGRGRVWVMLMVGVGVGLGLGLG